MNRTSKNKRQALVSSAFLTVPEAAAELRLDKGIVYGLVRRGELPSIRVAGPRTTRIPRAALDRLVTKALRGA